MLWTRRKAGGQLAGERFMTLIDASATTEGAVLRGQRHPAYGLVVDVDHGNGYRTLYAHVPLARPGERVARGAPIATVGSTGARLHLEGRHRVTARDPEP